MPTASCLTCGTDFQPIRRRPRFCRRACFLAWVRRQAQDTLVARFWAKVNKAGPNGCWLWTAATIKGYGQFHVPRNGGKNRTVYAHRYVWAITNGPIADDLVVCHRCDVPLCVNPDHLFLGTQADNLADAREKGRLDESRPRTSKLTLADRLDIWRATGGYGLGVALARRYGVSKSAICVIRRGHFAGCPNRGLQAPPAEVEQPARPFDSPHGPFQRVPSVQLPIVGEVR